jgi:hydroxymethylpyrimidine pyrophosphatase-like HAD family hydrolase
MKNSFPEVFPHANYITENDNNNSGVAEALNKFIINNR